MSVVCINQSTMISDEPSEGVEVTCNTLKDKGARLNHISSGQQNYICNYVNTLFCLYRHSTSCLALWDYYISF